ncbi:MAG: type IV pilin protein [Gammaproteobacteria bacterium]
MITKNKGLTLIELMIVVAIVGIIGAFAFPSYQNQVRRSNRTDAYTALTQMANQQEKWYLANNTYTDGADGPADLGRTEAPPGIFLTDEGYYQLTIPPGDPTTAFTLTATAVAGGTQAADTGCTALTLTSTGLKTPPECW